MCVEASSMMQKRILGLSKFCPACLSQAEKQKRRAKSMILEFIMLGLLIEHLNYIISHTFSIHSGAFIAVT
jgi:hypothetical protein